MMTRNPVNFADQRGRSGLGSSRSGLVERLESRRLLSNTWFVSPNGSDSNPGTQAAPFKTIQQAANIAGAGDTVAIRAGVYHETVSINNSGTSALPITFEAYNGENVVVDGADPLTQWTRTAANTWTAPMNWDLGAGNNQLFLDGKMIGEARWPNSVDPLHPTLAKISSATSSNGLVTLYDPALTQSAGFWNGAIIHMTPGDSWVTHTATVSASGVGWIRFAYTAGQYEMPVAGNHFYLSGIAGIQDAPDEWFRSASGQVSLILPAGQTPSGHVIEAKARDNAFDITGAFIKIQGINVLGATIVTSASASHLLLSRVAAEYISNFNATSAGWVGPSNTGITLLGDYDLITNSVIAYSAGDGITLIGYGSRAVNNLVHDVDYSGGDYAGVRVGNALVGVDHNTIYNCGRDGIQINGAADHITSNVVHDFSLLDSDCGGIYTIGHNGQETDIAFNIVYNGRASGFGATGLFLDNDSSHFIVERNITYNVDTGLKMNLSSLGNTIVNNTIDAVGFSLNNTWNSPDWTGTVVQNNIFTHRAVFGLHATIAKNVTTDSYFKNAAGGDFELMAGSPAIGAGAPLPSGTHALVASPPDAGALPYGVTPFVSGATLALLPPDPTVTSLHK